MKRSNIPESIHNYRRDSLATNSAILHALQKLRCMAPVCYHRLNIATAIVRYADTRMHI